jgi:hypothetical protein
MLHVISSRPSRGEAHCDDRQITWSDLNELPTAW